MSMITAWAIQVLPAPDAVKSSIIKILDTEDPLFVHGYMSNSGYEEVRQAVADNLNERFQWQYKMEDIIMTVGAASGINDILNLFLDSGDEVVAFAPFFGEYRNYVITAGGVLKAVPADTETFQINIDGLDAVITEKTKLIIVNNPNNPTGVIYSGDTLDQLQKALERGPKARIGASVVCDFQMNHTESLFMMITSCRLCRPMSKTV